MRYIRSFEAKKEKNYERKFIWINQYNEDHPESIIDFYQSKIVNISDQELLPIREKLKNKGLIIIKSDLCWNIRNSEDKPRIGDFVVDKTFFKISDEYFIFIDNREIFSMADEDDGDGHEEEYFKCDQLYGFLKFIDDEFENF